MSIRQSGESRLKYHRFLWNRSGTNLDPIVSGEPPSMSGPCGFVVVNPKNILTQNQPLFRPIV